MEGHDAAELPCMNNPMEYIQVQYNIVISIIEVTTLLVSTGILVEGGREGGREVLI